MEHKLTEEKIREIVRDEIEKFNKESTTTIAKMIKKELMNRNLY